MIYYYLDPQDGEIEEMIRLFTDIQRIMKHVPDRSESGLHMQLVLDEPKGFDGFMAHYGKFSGVKNYIAVIGKKGRDLEEKCGYYGEKVVLYAQRLGLNTCWVALTYSKIKTAFQWMQGKSCVW